MIRKPLFSVTAAHVVQQYLIDHQIIQDSMGVIWPSFLVMSETASDAIVILNSGARVNGRISRSGEVIQSHKLQIIAKSIDFDNAFTKLRQIELALLQIRTLTSLQVMGLYDALIDVQMTSFNLITTTTPVTRLSENEAFIFTLNGYINANEVS